MGACRAPPDLQKPGFNTKKFKFSSDNEVGGVNVLASYLLDEYEKRMPVLRRCQFQFTIFLELLTNKQTPLKHWEICHLHNIIRRRSMCSLLEQF